MDKFLKKNLLSLIILIVLLIVLFKTCTSHTTVEQPTIVRDTIWTHKDSFVITKPQVVNTIPVNVYHDSLIKEYVPDTNYAKLVKQYTELAERFLSLNIHQDSIRIDSIGFVRITDTVSHNLITGRKTSYKFSYPTIKETITIPEEKKGQVYFGFGVGGQNKDLLKSVNINLLYKNKKDVMFGPSVSLDQDGTVEYGVQAFWKIKLK
jgi:hypothetical protein